MQYKVPQNVDMEDRVIGPLSLRQFMIILVGVGVVGFLYFILQGPLRIFFFLFSILILGGSFAIALGNYGGQNAEEFLFSVVNTLSKPMARVWKKHEEIPQMIKPASKSKTKVEPKPKEKSNIEDARGDLERLAELVDSGGYYGSAGKDVINPNTPILATESSGPQGLNDPLQQLDTAKKDIDRILDEAERKAPKREPLLSEEAKLSPTKEFRYPQIKVSDRKFVS